MSSEPSPKSECPYHQACPPRAPPNALEWSRGWGVCVGVGQGEPSPIPPGAAFDSGAMLKCNPNTWQTVVETVTCQGVLPPLDMGYMLYEEKDYILTSQKSRVCLPSLHPSLWPSL